MRGASSTRLRRQSSLDQWMITNVMKFILFRTIPLNKTAKERGSSLSNVCSVFVRWRGGQINVLSVHSRPPVLTVAVKDTPCPVRAVKYTPRVMFNVNDAGIFICFVKTKVVITVRTHFAGEVSRSPIPFLRTKLTNCYCLGVSIVFLLYPWLKAKVNGQGYKDLAIQVPWVLCIATVALVSPF